MMHTLDSMVETFRKETNMYNSDYTGCGGAGLITFYKAIGVAVPVPDDLSENLISTYATYVRKSLHPALAELCLLDFKVFLEFCYLRGLTKLDYSHVIQPDTLQATANDFSGYEGQKWKS